MMRVEFPDHHSHSGNYLLKNEAQAMGQALRHKDNITRLISVAIL